MYVKQYESLVKYISIVMKMFSNRQLSELEI